MDTEPIDPMTKLCAEACAMLPFGWVIWRDENFECVLQQGACELQKPLSGQVTLCQKENTALFRQQEGLLISP